MHRFILALTMAAIAAGAACAQDAPAPGSQGVTQADPTIADLVLTEIEKRIIRDYYRGDDDAAGQKAAKDKSGLPPGLAKKDTLPPGLAMQLERNGTLPPGLAKRDLPDDLRARLPRRPWGQNLVIVDDKVLLIQRATNLILDILLVAAAEAGD
jgi:Ni/Co efflux regulator RcnB